MLVLTRKLEEEIVIDLGGRPLRVRVLAIERGRVRLGFAAPDDVPVHRQEVWERVRAWHTGADSAPTLAGGSDPSGGTEIT
jgi:carbon storage regulator